MVPVGTGDNMVDKKLLLVNYDLTSYGIIIKNSKNMSGMNACLCAHKENTNKQTHTHTQHTHTGSHAYSDTNTHIT